MTERGDDGTTVYDHVFEDKGRKIKIIFNILDGPRRERVLPAEPESQLSRVKRAAEESQPDVAPNNIRFIFYFNLAAGARLAMPS